MYILNAYIKCIYKKHIMYILNAHSHAKPRKLIYTHEEKLSQVWLLMMNFEYTSTTLYYKCKFIIKALMLPYIQFCADTRL